MSDNVHFLSRGGTDLGTQAEANAEVIKLLEEALENARSGKTVGVVLIENFSAMGSAEWSWEGLHDFSSLGALERVKFDIMASMYKDREGSE